MQDTGVTSTHLTVVVERQEVQTTLLRELDMFAIRGRSSSHAQHWQ